MRGWGKGELAGRERAQGNSHYSWASEKKRQMSEPSLEWEQRLKGGITSAKGERKERGSDPSRRRRRMSPSAASAFRSSAVHARALAAADVLMWNGTAKYKPMDR